MRSVIVELPGEPLLPIHCHIPPPPSVMKVDPRDQRDVTRTEKEDNRCVFS